MENELKVLIRRARELILSARHAAAQGVNKIHVMLGEDVRAK